MRVTRFTNSSPEMNSRINLVKKSLTSGLGHTDLRRGHLLSQQLVPLVELCSLQFQVLGIFEIGTPCHDDQCLLPVVAELGPFSLGESVPQHDQAGSKIHVLRFLALEISEIGGHRHVEVFRHLWIFRLHRDVAVTS